MQRCDALEFALLILLHRLIEQIRVYLHEQLQRVVNHRVYCSVMRYQGWSGRSGWDLPVPMRSRVCVKSRENDRKDYREIIAHEIDDILVVPIQQRPLRNLEVLAVDTSGKLLEQVHLDLLEFSRVYDIKHFFHLAQEHDLLGRVHLRPEFEQAKHNILRKCRILLQELDNAICELWMVHRQALNLV